MVCFSLLLTLAIGADGPSAEDVRFFETHVRPILVEHCWKCHGEKKQWAELRLDSRAGLLKGGESGPAVDLTAPEASRLLTAIRHMDEDQRMPPKDEGRLTERQIDVLTQWVERGAPFPPEVAAKARHRDPEHWSFQPPRPQSPPHVRDANLSGTFVDDFILQALETKQLSLTAPADPRTLFRRISFDLTGLPPSPESIEAFLHDENPDAYERAVDRLLSDPAHGERWGRHWLDVARYADSNGLDENICHGNAWRYRDYVVAAFNSDKPYDRFLREQLAGDLLPFADDVQRREQLIAVGFLAIGPKVLAEVDEAKMQMDIIDEQLDTVGRALLGLTLGCARCHDHKFDPIDTADYYGLAGIFKSTRTMEHYRKIARWHENELPSDDARRRKSEYEATVAAKKAEVDAATDDATKKKLQEALTALQKTPPDLPTAMGAVDAKVEDVAIHIRGNPLKLGEVAPRHTPVVLRGPSPPAFSPDRSGRDELSQWLVDPQHPLTARVFVNRVWRQHFGRGLVASVDNFGLLGEKPSHPELLDALATRFVGDQWSVKKLQREIVCSETYRQGSSPSAAALAADPDNRLFSRAAVRRLEAEAIRDSLLAAGDGLDRTLGGPVIKVKHREFLFDHTSKDLTDYSSPRRSLYLPVVRNNTYDLFALFDFPDAATVNGDRTTTTVAPQALLMLNSPLVNQAAAAFARRLLAENSDDEVRLLRLRAIAFGRPATADELATDRAFLNEVEHRLAHMPDAAAREQQAWSLLCQTVLAANEFLYVK